MLFCNRQLIVTAAARWRWLARAAMLVAVCALTACSTGAGGDNFVPPNIEVPPETSWSNYPQATTPQAEYAAQWGLNNVNAAAAHDEGYWGLGVTVGILDTGVRTTHPDLADNLVPGMSFVSGISATAVFDRDGHGTHVAGIVGAAKNNTGMHGVAPSVSIMPLQFGDENGDLRGDWAAAIRHARDNNIQVVNNSWGGGGPEYIGGSYNGMTIMFRLPRLAQLMALERDAGGTNSDLLRDFNELASIMRTPSVDAVDMALVWAAGNDGWHAGATWYYCDAGEGSIANGDCQGPVNSDGQVTTAIAAVNAVPITTLLSGFMTQEVILTVLDTTVNDDGDLLVWESADYGNLATLGLSEGSASDMSLTPYFHADLLGRFIAVAATDINNNLASFSNGCGTAMNWCMAAPGNGIYSTYESTPFATWGGTSQAAPHVSGGLAVLKSRLPSMPMSVVVTILLTNALDLGADGVDEVYGWGLMDLGKAVTAMNGMDMMNSSGTRSRVFESMSHSSPALRGLAAGLAGVSVAVAYGPELYFNMPMSELLKEAPPAPLAASGLAAMQMLRGGAAAAEGWDTRAEPGLAALENAADGRARGAEFVSGGVMPLVARYEWCGDCGAGLWEAFSLDAPAAAPFFANAEQQRTAAAWRLPGRWQVFGDAGLGGDTRSVLHSQIGARRVGELAGGRARWLAEASRISENGAVLGAELAGGMAVEGAAARQGRLALEADAGGWRWFAAAMAGRGEATGADGGLLARLDYRYRAWQAGADGASVLRHGDRMRFGLSRHSGVRQGEATLRPVALSAGGLAAGEARVGWSDVPTTTLHWGYYAEVTQNFEVGVGYEHARRGDEDAHASSVAARWRVW